MVGRYVPPRKTHCIHGHEFTSENTYVAANGDRHCRACKNISRSTFYEKHTEKCHLWKKEDQLKRLYGIQSVDERDSILVEQGSACAICGRTGLVWGKGYNDVWHIDHAHDQPGTHRAILCASCNTALGRLEAHMLRVIEYLMKWSPAFEKQLRDLLK